LGVKRRSEGVAQVCNNVREYRRKGEKKTKYADDVVWSGNSVGGQRGDGGYGKVGKEDKNWTREGAIQTRIRGSSGRTDGGLLPSDAERKEKLLAEAQGTARSTTSNSNNRGKERGNTD